MTDKYAPNLTHEEMERLLGEEETGVLCLADVDVPYGVPISYAWLNGSIVFHCAMKGRKLDVLRRNPRVTFVVYRHPDRVVPHAEGECDYKFESVLVFGRARIIDDAEERFGLLSRFQRHFYERLGLNPESNPVTEKAAAGCGCVVIEVEEMTGRRKPPSAAVQSTSTSPK